MGEESKGNNPGQVWYFLEVPQGFGKLYESCGTSQLYILICWMIVCYGKPNVNSEPRVLTSKIHGREHQNEHISLLRHGV